MSQPAPTSRVSFLSSLAASLILATVLCPSAFAQGTVLHGEASEQEYLTSPANKGLSRSDIDEAGDPFSGARQAPDPALSQTLDPPPVRNLQAGAKLDEFAGDAMQKAAAAAAENHPAMQIAWDAWHKRVATAIFQRWTFLANAAFKETPPLYAKMSYTVTREGLIQDVKFLAKSPDVMYNAMVAQAIQSVSGDRNLLQFPQGSRRLSVEKAAEFCQNCAQPVNKMRYATGDSETVPGR